MRVIVFLYLLGIVFVVFFFKIFNVKKLGYYYYFYCRDIVINEVDVSVFFLIIFVFKDNIWNFFFNDEVVGIIVFFYSQIEFNLIVVNDVGDWDNIIIVVDFLFLNKIEVLFYMDGNGIKFECWGIVSLFCGVIEEFYV